jgi:hypothetical protein
MRLGVKNMYDLIKLRASIEDYVYYVDFKEKSPDEIRDIAQTTNSPIHLAYLSTHDDTLIRRSVAINKNVPIRVLVNLSNDPNQYVRLSVAKNAKTPKDILKKLMNDSFPDVGKAAADTFTKVGGTSGLGSSIRGLVGPMK